MNTLLRWEPTSRTRWNPFKDHDRDELESRLATLLAAREATANGGKEALTVAQWSPLVDITEDEKEYLIKAELPGLKKEDVRLTVDNDVLSVSGERKFEKEENGKKYHRIERAYGSFVRSFCPFRGCGWAQRDRRFQGRRAPGAPREIREGETESCRDSDWLVLP